MKYLFILSSLVILFLVPLIHSDVEIEISDSLTILTGNLTKFLELTDTPSSYTSNGSNCLVVNGGETAVILAPCGTVVEQDPHWTGNISQWNASYLNTSNTSFIRTNQEINLDVNSSINWNTESNSYFNDTNITEFNNVEKELTLNKTWLDTFINSVVTVVGITWAEAVNGTLFSQALYDTNYTVNHLDYLSTINDSYLRNTGDIGIGDYNFNSNGLFLKVSNSFVGIGKINPAEVLDVNGSITLGATDSSIATIRRGEGVQEDGGVLSVVGGAANFNLGSPQVGGDLLLNGGAGISTGADGNVIIGTLNPGNGRVGIKTANPSDTFNVAGTTNLTGNTTIDETTFFVDALKKQYKEIPVVRGLTKDGLMMEIYSSPDGMSWTITVTRPNKIMCLMDGGSFLIDMFDDLEKKEKGQDINALTE